MIKTRKIANPRTQESKNFLGNIKAILHLWYIEGRKPWEIGKLFCIRPEKINHLIRLFVENAEERSQKYQLQAQEKSLWLESKV